VLLGIKSLLTNLSLVKIGDLLFVWNHCTIDARSYVNPSVATTGSEIKSDLKVLSKKDVGTLILWSGISVYSPSPPN
jgi:hypothetical protein